MSIENGRGLFKAGFHGNATHSGIFYAHFRKILQFSIRYCFDPAGGITRNKSLLGFWPLTYKENSVARQPIGNHARR